LTKVGSYAYLCSTKQGIKGKLGSSGAKTWNRQR